ncbi:MAG: cytochrome c [Verrucomicrobiota bacterium]|nr:cytochrome c [Verrucomicrobiota bacterium]MCC6822969.1 cytochrome c [Limisphaerales bacterium]
MNAEPSQSGRVVLETEPTATGLTVPMWLIAAMLVLLFLGAWYFDARGGWFEAKVYEPYHSVADVARFQPRSGGDAVLLRGKVLYEQNCALCHNPDGMGKLAQAPPLAGSEWVLAAGVNRLIRIPQVGLAGPIEVKGQLWNLNMAAMGVMYPDEDLAAVLSYIRNAWGNKASVVTAEQVKKVRTELAGRSQPYAPDELKKEAE